MTVNVRYAVVGAGIRGRGYAAWIHRHDGAELAAVADPDPARRQAAAGSQTARQYADWRTLLDSERAVDAVVIATQDREHVEPALAFAARGVHILLEKPMAPTEQECRKVVAAVEAAGILFGVCHVLRYTSYTDLVKQVVDAGVLGRIMDVQHLEPVGWWHMAHSYVRGSWRREADATPMLLAKSCHDLDWITYVTGESIEQVASVGGLHHFRADQKPAGAGERCTSCEIEPSCPYSAVKLYATTLERHGLVWPVSVVTRATDREGLLADLAEGPYGRCVYACDNDVVDHQSVLMRLTSGATATFTMTAFSEQAHRKTRIFGTHGCLDGDGERITVTDFRTGEVTERRAVVSGAAHAGGGHGGGDAALMAAFTAAVASDDPGRIRSGARESLHSHLAVFAAERARHGRRLETVPLE